MRSLRIASALLAVLTAACGGGDDDGPTIDSFTASATKVGVGDRVQLSWKVSGAATVSIDATPGGTLIDGATQAENTVPSGPISATTRFVLTARDAAGASATAEVSVAVDASILRITRFVANPSSIDSGGSTMLSWSISGSPIGKVRLLDADGVALYDGAEAQRSQAVAPTQTTVYRLEVSNIGQSLSATTAVTVTSNPPRIVRFSASPNPATSGARVNVSWQTEGADEVQITRDGTVVRAWTSNGAATGFTSFVFADRSSMVTLEARNRSGTVSESVTVSTLPRPTARLTVTRDRFTTATATVGVHWEVANSSTVTLTINGRAPAGFTGQASGDLTLTATRTLALVLVGQNPIETVTATAAVRRVSVFTQDVVVGAADVPAVGAAVRVENAAGTDFQEGVTDAAGRATIEIDADNYPVSVSVAMPGHFAAAVVGLDAPMTDAIRIDPLPPPPPMVTTAVVSGTFFSKSALANRVTLSGYGSEGFDGTSVAYDMGYVVSPDPLTLVALEFDGNDDLINGAIVTATRTGADMEVPVTFPRPLLVAQDTVVSLRVPSTGAFMGQRYSLAGQAVVQHRAGASNDVIVGGSALGALSGGALPWTISTFGEPGFELSFAGIAVNGSSLRFIAVQRTVGMPATIDVAPIARFALSTDAGPLADLRVDFEGTGYDGLVIGIGNDDFPFAYRVVLPADRAHRGVWVPHLPSTVRFALLGSGVIGNANVLAGAWSLGGSPAYAEPFTTSVFGYPDGLRYTVERPGAAFALTGF